MMQMKFQGMQFFSYFSFTAYRMIKVVGCRSHRLIPWEVCRELENSYMVSDTIVWMNYEFKEYDECVNSIRPIIERAMNLGAGLL